VRRTQLLRQKSGDLKVQIPALFYAHCAAATGKLYLFKTLTLSTDGPGGVVNMDQSPSGSGILVEYLS
jgi:hypothetical protein